MRDVLRFVYRHWQIVSSILVVALSLGAARQRFSGLEDRVSFIEESHPDAIAAMAQRDAAEDAAIRLELEAIHNDVALTRADVAYIRGRIGAGSN